MKLRPGAAHNLYPAWAALAILAGLALPAAAHALPVFESGSQKPAPVKRPLHRLDFKIQKLSCAVCGKEYVQVLSGMRGVKYARVELHQPWDAEALVIFDARQTGRQKILDALHRLHYYEADVKER